MSITYRKYEIKDYNKVLDFFRSIYREMDTPPFWLTGRWEYAEYLVSPLHKYRGYSIDWKETILLWETDTGEIVGILCSENPDEDIFIHTRLKYRYLEEEMTDVAETRIIKDIIGKSMIRIWCQKGDSYRESFLRQKGYVMQKEVDYLNWRELSIDLPSSKIPDGFILHDMTSENKLNLQSKIDQMTGAFDSESYPVEIYRNMQQADFYRKEYDLYTTDRKGNVSSFCIIWYDRDLNIGYFEPVGTDARHRGKGLGKTTLISALERLKKAGVKRAFVGSSGDDRRNFYKRSGFINCVSFHPWMKVIK